MPKDYELPRRVIENEGDSVLKLLISEYGRAGTAVLLDQNGRREATIPRPDDKHSNAD